MSALEEMAKRIKSLEQRQGTLETEEAPIGSSPATKQYPIYQVPFGNFLFIPSGVTLHTSGEVIGTVSGPGTFAENTNGNGLNAIRDGRFTSSFRAYPRGFETAFLSALNPTAGDAFFDVSGSPNYDPTIVYVGATVFPEGCALPPGTTITAIDAPNDRIYLSAPFITGFAGTTFMYLGELVVIDTPRGEWVLIREANAARFGEAYRNNELVEPGSVSTIPSGYFKLFLSNMGFYQTIFANDGEYMAASQVTLSFLADVVSGFGKIGILTWNGDTDNVPVSIVDTWGDPPTFETFLGGATCTLVGSYHTITDGANIITRTMPSSYSNIIVFVYMSGLLSISNIQLERGTTNSAYQPYLSAER